MPITTQCPYCQKKFRTADKLTGKPVKCPGCQGVVRVPAEQTSADKAQQATQPEPSDSSWYILSANDEKMGPVSKEQLDNLATKGRLSFCQVRRSDWQAWKWADDVYPELPVSERKAEPSDSSPSVEKLDSARLVTCPDCNKTVSRRATQCPHCGCPAAVLLKQGSSTKDGPVAVPPPPVPDAAKEAALNAALDAVGPKKAGAWRPYLIVGAVVLLLVTVATPLYIWWRIHSAAEQVAEQLGVSLGEPEPPRAIPEPEESSEEMLSPDGKRECIDEVSRKMAEHIDGFQRQNHVSLSMISQTLESVQMLEALAGGDLDAIPDSTGVVPGGGGVEPYESQLDGLFVECRDWVREHVKRGPCTSGDVWETAQQWAREKQEKILEPLEGLPTQDLTLPTVPETPSADG